MGDLKATLETFSDKALKILKSADKILNGEEKQLVLEIGSHTTKIVEYILKSNTIEVTGGAVLNTPVNSIQDDRLIDSTVLANVIKQALKEEKIKTKEFVVSIASKEIITREMNVPNMKERELKSFVQLNSNDIFPVKLINYVLGYNMIEKGVNNRVMIAAIPKDIVLTYMELADKLGMKLKGINYSGYELYNFIDLEINTQNETYLAIDLGARNTNIVIVSNGILKFNKIIPKGSQSTSSYISEELNCSLTKAEQLKRLYNTIEESEESPQDSEVNVVAKYTRRCVDDVLQDILRIREFYNSNNPKNKLTKIYILGTAAKIVGIEEYISQKISIDTVAVKLFTKVSFGKNALKLKARQHNFINCLGTHELKNRRLYVIKEGLHFKRNSFLLKPKFHKLAICVVLIMIMFLINERNSIIEITNRIETYKQYSESKSEVVALQDAVKKKQNELTAAQDSFNKAKKEFEEDFDIIRIVENGIKALDTDAKIYIIKYKFQGKNIEITGRIEPPIGIDQNHENYYIYKNLPFNLVEHIGKEFNKKIIVTPKSLNGTATIEFTLKI